MTILTATVFFGPKFKPSFVWDEPTANWDRFFLFATFFHAEVAFWSASTYVESGASWSGLLRFVREDRDRDVEELLELRLFDLPRFR